METGQGNDAKAWIQHATEVLVRDRIQSQSALFCWLCLVALVALASAGLWVGVGGIAVIGIVNFWLGRFLFRNAFRFDRFRHRYRELLEKAEDMRNEDREFVRKYEDSILYWLAVPEHKREAVSATHLYHVETLYRDYNGLPGSDHGAVFRFPRSEDHLQNCKLCAAGQRVRDHIGNALSKFETAVESARQTLITQIDRSNPEGAIGTQDFLEDFQRCWLWVVGGGDKHDSMESLGNKERWTFEEADRVRQLLSAAKQNYWDWDPPREGRVYKALSAMMEASAKQNGVEHHWKLYTEGTDWLAKEGGAFKRIRRVIARHNPESMFRELLEEQYGAVYQLEELKPFGYDSNTVRIELTGANKLIARDKGKWGRTYDKELQAAQLFALECEVQSEQTYKEWGKN